MAYRDLAKKKATKAAYNAAYQAAHREERAAYDALRNAAHRDEKKAANAAYRMAHREEIAAHKAARRGQTAAVARAYCASHQLQRRASGSASFANQRAKRLGLTDRLTQADIVALWERQTVCVRCGTGRGVDHIIAFADGGANTPENIQTMCHPCNTAKDGEAKQLRARKAFCVRGHPQTADNLRLNQETGYTVCRPCAAERDQKHRRAHAGTPAIVEG
jgi:hypothetical protein